MLVRRATFPLRRRPLAAFLLMVAILAPGPLVAQSDQMPPASPEGASDADSPPASPGDQAIGAVDRKFPETGDPGPRRAALEQVLQSFPRDRRTLFRAEARIAILDWNAGRKQMAHERLQSLLKRGAAGIGPEIYSWAQVMDGNLLHELGQPREAAAVWESVARSRRPSDQRRAEAAVALADLQMVEAPAAALALLQDIAALPSGDTPAVEARIAHLQLITGQPNALTAALAYQAEIQPDSGEAKFAALLGSTASWGTPGDEARIADLLALVARLRPSPGASLGAAVEACRADLATRRIQVQVSQLALQSPLAAWIPPRASPRPLVLADLDQLAAAAVRAGDARRALGLSLRALADFRDQAFPRRLWNAANYAEWTERQLGASADMRVCPTLLDLCDRLPVTQPFYAEGRLLRAKRAARIGNGAAEQAILRELLAQPQLPRTFFAPTCQLLGESLLASNDVQGAIAAFLAAAPAGSSSAAGADCLLRAAFVALNLGDDDAATRAIRELAQAPAQVIDQSESSLQIRELVALVQSGQAPATWQAGRAWWPDWKRLDAAVGGAPDGTIERTPLIATLRGLSEELEAARSRRDAQHFLHAYALLLSAARWQPSLSPAVAAANSLWLEFFPTERDPFQALEIRVLEAPHPPAIPNWRLRELYLATSYYNAHRAADALRIATDYAASPQPDDALTHTMHQIGALAALATGQNWARSAADLASDLADPHAGTQRALAVGLLADLDQRLGRSQDAQRLLQSEVDNPTIQSDPAGRAALAKRLQNFPTAGMAAPDVRGWLQSVGLPWYDYAEPAALDDAQRIQLDEVLQASPRSQLSPSKIKLLLLAAQDQKQPVDLRREAWREAARQLVVAAPTYDRMDAIVRSVILRPDADEATCLRVLWTTLATLAAEGRRTEFGRWRSDPRCARFDPEFQRCLAILDDEVALDRASSPAILALSRKLAATPMTSFGLLAQEDLLGFLLRRGDIAGAEALAAMIPAWQFAEPIQSGRDEYALEVARQIRNAQATRSVHEALAKCVATDFPPAPEALPADFREVRITNGLPLRQSGATLQACRYLVKTQQFERNDFQFWATFLQVLPPNRASVKVIMDLLAAGLGAAADDEVRSELVVLFFSSADIDNPDVRAALEAGFAPWREPEQGPLCAMVIRLYEINRDLRLGVPVDLPTAFAEFSDPRARVVEFQDSLRCYTLARQTDALRRVVDQVDLPRLLSPEFVEQALPAFQLLEREPEVKAARAVAARALHESVLDSWARQDEAAGNRALDLAELLGDPQLLPAGWVLDLSSGTGNPRFQDRIRLVSAYLAGNWSAVEAAAARLNSAYPSSYGFYRYRGIALHHLGRDPEAAAALAIYTAHAHDELAYPSALQLLRKLPAPSAAGQVRAE